MEIQTLANLLGYIGIIIIFIQILIGSRHIFKYFTTDTVLINKIHKYLGIYGTLLIMAHPIEETVVYMSSWMWMFVINFDNSVEGYISLGRIAFFLLLIVWISSAILRDKIKWRPWKYIHLLSYPLFLLSLYHAMYSGSWAKEYAIVYMFLYILGLLFLAIVIRRLCAWAGLFKKNYIIKSVENVENEIVILTLSPLDGAVSPLIGQHMYLQLNPFTSEHPFTVMEVKENGDLVFGIRNLGRFAEDLHRKLQGEKLLLDGPYGVFTKEGQNDSPKVIISGGVGVTPFVRLVEEYGNRDTWYINCNKSLNIAIRRELIMSKVGHYLDVSGIIDEATIRSFLTETIPNMRYFICGAPGFIYTVKGILLHMGIKSSDIYYEELGF